MKRIRSRCVTGEPEPAVDDTWLMHGVDDPGVALALELVHVLANSGEHVDWPGNLMQGRTTPDGVKLTAGQCVQIEDNGVAENLLQVIGN